MINEYHWLHFHSQPSPGSVCLPGLMGNVTTWRHWTTMWQKTQVHGNLTCRSEPQFHYAFYARADTSALAECCVHVPLILHGHVLGARIQCATMVGWPKEELKQSIIDLGSYPLKMAVTHTVLTVQKRPRWHGFLTISAKSIWIHLFYYHQPGGQRKNQL